MPFKYATEDERLAANEASRRRTYERKLKKHGAPAEAARQVALMEFAEANRRLREGPFYRKMTPELPQPTVAEMRAVARSFGLGNAGREPWD